MTASSRSLSSSIRAAIGRTASRCLRAWWLQKRSSPPPCRTTRTYAVAPQRSHRSAAVNETGGASVGVISPPPALALATMQYKNDRYHSASVTTVLHLYFVPVCHTYLVRRQRSDRLVIYISSLHTLAIRSGLLPPVRPRSSVIAAG